MSIRSNFTTMSSMTIKSIKSVKSIQKPATDEVQPITFVQYNWLKDAKIYNKRWLRVPNDWIIEKADIIVLLFTARGVDREGVIKKFYHVYESTKYVHIPIEVIFLPMDETEEDALAAFKEQANWFTLRFDDVLVHTLKFMYGITCIPHLLVFNTKCDMISYDGIAELDRYGKNAVVSWMSLAPTTKRQRRRSEDAEYYGTVWRYAKQEEKLSKYEYQRRFKEDGKPMVHRPDFEGHAKPEKDHYKPPEDEDQFKPSESYAQSLEDSATSGLTTSEVPHFEPPEDGKPSVIQIRRPEDQYKTAESHALLADDLPKSRNDLERSSASALEPGQDEPSQSHAAGSKSESKHSKPRVQLPEEDDDDDKPESHVQISDNRSKSATQSRQTSKSTHHQAARSKSAKFADDS